MKKSLIFLASMLCLTLFIGLVSQSRQIYHEERILWWIQNDFKKIENPFSPESESLVSKIINRYENFIKSRPNSVLAPKAKLMLGNTLKSQKKYAEARKVFEEIVLNYQYNNEIVAQAQFAIAQSHEVEDNWPKAVTVYRGIVKDYPLTLTGFSVPYYLGGFYQARGLNSTARNAFLEATEFYQNIAANYPDSPLGLSALKMAVKSSLAVGDWLNAYFAAREAFLKYPISSSLQETVQMIYDICIKKMNDPDRVIKTYDEFIKRNPGHPMNKSLQNLIEKLKNLEIKSRTINLNEKR